MSANELRKAAETLRIDHASTEIYQALAAWLDDIAAGWMWDGEEPGVVVDYEGDRLTLEESMDMHAIKIARLINGDAS